MAFIDDFLGSKYNETRKNFIKKLKNICNDIDLIEDAFSEEVMYQLKRRSENKFFGLPNNGNFETINDWQASCIFNNIRRNIFRKMKKSMQKANLPELENKLKDVSNVIDDSIAKDVWKVLIDNHKLIDEFKKYDITHPRGRIKEQDIQIWAMKELGDHSYDDIQEMYDISYDTARQAVSKVKWGIETLKERKHQDGTSGIFFLTKEKNSDMQAVYFYRKNHGEIRFSECFLQCMKDCIYNDSEKDFDKIITEFLSNDYDAFVIDTKEKKEILISNVFYLDQCEDITYSETEYLINLIFNNPT